MKTYRYNKYRKLERFLGGYFYDIILWWGKESESENYLRQFIMEDIEQVEDSTLTGILEMYNEYADIRQIECIDKISQIDFKNHVNVYNIVNLAYRLAKAYHWTQKNKKFEIIDIENYNRFQQEQEKSLNYFRHVFTKEIDSLKTVDNISSLKKKYKGILRNINSNLYKAFRENPYILNKAKYSPRIPDKYSQGLRLTVIDRLKDLEQFTPYKQVILDLVEVRDGYHHHASMYQVKDFIDEWDLYYTQYPSVCLPVNKIANQKFVKNEPLLSAEYLLLFIDKNLTVFGYEHLYDILDKMQKIIDLKEEKQGYSILHKYANKYNSKSSKYVAKTHERPKDYCDEKVYWNLFKITVSKRKFSTLLGWLKMWLEMRCKYQKLIKAG